MRASRRVLHWSARGLTVAVGVAVAVATGLAVSFAPAARVGSSVPQSEITPVPTEQTRVCPGPFLALGLDTVDASRAVTVGSADTVSAAEGATPVAHPLAQEGALLRPGDGSPLALTVPVPSGATRPPAIGASQSQQIQTDELSGLAAVSCGEAVAESWLVAGSTKLGQTTIVLLANPTAVEAAVELTVYAAQGVVGGGPAVVTVAPGSQLMVPLAGIATELDAPVVHVDAKGGRVFASLQQSAITGIIPGGLETVGPVAAPATTVTVPGVMIRGIEAVRGEAAPEGYPVTLPALRLVAPGDREAHVRVAVAPEGGAGAGMTWDGELGPGIVTEVPLNELADGDYSITVTSDVPVVAAARTSTSDGTHRDFAWFGAASPLGHDAMLAVTRPAALHLANPGSAEATVTVAGPDGVEQKATVAPGTTRAVPLQQTGSYRLEGTSGMVASVGYADAGALASFTVGSAGSLVAPITIYPR